MKNHILYRNEIITPQDKRLPVGDPTLKGINAIHAAVLEICGQKSLEYSERNKVLPHPEDALQEGRVLVLTPKDGVYEATEVIAQMANTMQRSSRTLKNGGSLHPMGRYHSSAVLTGMPNVGDAISRRFIESAEPICSAARQVLMPRGLTVQGFAGRGTALIAVRPLYACDLSYLSPEEISYYREFYGDGDCTKGGFALD